MVKIKSNHEWSWKCSSRPSTAPRGRPRPQSPRGCSAAPIGSNCPHAAAFRCAPGSRPWSGASGPGLGFVRSVVGWLCGRKVIHKGPGRRGTKYYSRNKAHGLALVNSELSPCFYRGVDWMIKIRAAPCEVGRVAQKQIEAQVRPVAVQPNAHLPARTAARACAEAVRA